MRLSRSVATVLALALSAGTASADPVVASQWYSFGFEGVGSVGGPATFPSPGTINAPNAPWTYTSLSAFSVTVNDGFAHGDMFELYNGATLIGSTSVPATTGTCDEDVIACAADPDASKGTFLLGPGSYSFEVRATASPFGAGDAFFRIDPSISAVPEPATVALFATGLVAIGAAARRRNRATA